MLYHGGTSRSDLFSNHNASTIACSTTRGDYLLDDKGRLPTPELPHRPGSSNEKEGRVLFNDTLNTFYLRLYGVRHMVKDHSDSERGNPLPPHGLLFPISSKGSFIYIIHQTG